jgi:hypothetical protein
LPSTPVDSEGEAALAVIDELAPVESALLDQYEWFTAESADDRLILFGVPLGEMPTDSLPYASATFQPDGDTWLPEGWGQCRIEVSSPGFGNAYWVLDPEIDPASSGTELHVLINERECASGEPPVGREIVPVVLEEADSVTIAVLVERVSGAAECPSNPWHPITIELSEPVGDRTLFDASVAPQIERFWPPGQDVLDSLGAQPWIGRVSLGGLTAVGHATADLLVGHIFDMSRDPPLVSLTVEHASGAISVELVRRLTKAGRSVLESLGISGVDIVDVEVGHQREHPELLAARRQHDVRVADNQLRMHDPSVVLVDLQRLGIEHGDEEVQGLAGVLGNDLRGDGVISVRWVLWHRCLLSGQIYPANEGGNVSKSIVTSLEVMRMSRCACGGAS